MRRLLRKFASLPAAWLHYRGTTGEWISHFPTQRHSTQKYMITDWTGLIVLVARVSARSVLLQRIQLGVVNCTRSGRVGGPNHRHSHGEISNFPCIISLGSRSRWSSCCGTGRNLVRFGASSSSILEAFNNIIRSLAHRHVQHLSLPAQPRLKTALLWIILASSLPLTSTAWQSRSQWPTRM